MSVQVYDDVSEAWKLVADLPGKLQVKSVSDNYTVEDGYDVILVTAASDKTITLPAAGSHTGRALTIVKAGSGSGKVIVDGNAGETIKEDELFGQTEVHLLSLGSRITIVSDGSCWHTISGTNQRQVVRLYGSKNHAEIFAALAPYIPNEDDEMMLNGAFLSESYMRFCSWAVRMSAGIIYIYASTTTGNGYIEVQDGDTSSTSNCNISWPRT